MRSQTTKHGTQRPSLSRKKSRKLKLLSLLRREDVAGKEREKEGMCPEMVKKEKLSLVPVKPENLEYDDDRDASQYENVSILFNPADSNATLNGLLGDETTTSEEGPLASSSPSYGYGDGVELLRTAMRGREKREGEEKWVRYSEVVAEEVSSRYGGEEGLGGGLGWWRKGLDLKLDYGEILKAWSDKGPLYVGDGGGESPQTVPDLASLFHVPTEGWNGNWNNMWVVREMEVREEGVEGWKWKKGQREASVMRYKAKRQCRLFSKRIRYQVRKLNADKRPRLKGRFVKRG